MIKEDVKRKKEREREKEREKESGMEGERASEWEKKRKKWKRRKKSSYWIKMSAFLEKKCNLQLLIHLWYSLCAKVAGLWNGHQAVKRGKARQLKCLEGSVIVIKGKM